jgi:hypothetical protein
MIPIVLESNVKDNPFFLSFIGTRKRENISCNESSFFNFEQKQGFIQHLQSKTYLQCSVSHTSFEPICRFVCDEEDQSILKCNLHSVVLPFLTISPVLSKVIVEEKEEVKQKRYQMFIVNQKKYDSKIISGVEFLNPESGLEPNYFQYCFEKEWFVAACPTFLQKFPYFWYNSQVDSFVILHPENTKFVPTKNQNTTGKFPLSGRIYHQQLDKFLNINNGVWQVHHPNSEKDSFCLLQESEIKLLLESFHPIKRKSLYLSENMTWRYYNASHEAPLWKLDSAGRLIAFSHEPKIKKQYMAYDIKSDQYLCVSNREHLSLIYIILTESPNTPINAYDDTYVLTPQGKGLHWKDFKNFQKKEISPRSTSEFKNFQKKEISPRSTSEFQKGQIDSLSLSFSSSSSSSSVLKSEKVNEYIFEGPYTLLQKLKFECLDCYDSDPLFVFIILFVWLPFLIISIVFFICLFRQSWKSYSPTTHNVKLNY